METQRGYPGRDFAIATGLPPRQRRHGPHASRLSEPERHWQRTQRNAAAAARRAEVPCGLLSTSSVLATYGQAIIPVGVGWNIAAGIVLLRHEPGGRRSRPEDFHCCSLAAIVTGVVARSAWQSSASSTPPGGDATLVRLVHSGLPDTAARRLHREGWTRYLDQLAETPAP